jgi:predicted phosphodiesterase
MLAVISDIHSNLGALEAVLADIDRVGVDELICLGDVVSFGPQPRETLRRVQALNCPVVMGNTDNGLLRPHTPEPKPTELQKIFAAVEHWYAAQLTEEDRASFAPFSR